MTTPGHRIWIDLDNSPHVPFFIPIIRELEAKGHSVLLTTRDCFQVCDLANYYRLKHKTVGRHYGANKILKLLGLFWRTLQLAPLILRNKPDLSLSHGSRSLVLLSSLLRIPTILLFDYEFARWLPLIKPTLGLAPEAIRDPRLAKHFKKGLHGYHGLKEDVYVSSFVPTSSPRLELGLTEHDIVTTIRPPAREAHYHNPASDRLFAAVVEFLGSSTSVRMIILPRHGAAERDEILRRWPTWCEERRVIIPDKVLNGLDLISTSDFVISGGGTMNREAAAFGVPVYSIFRGELGAVDRALSETGRLVLIRTEDEVRLKIRPIKRTRVRQDTVREQSALSDIMTTIDNELSQIRSGHHTERT